MTIRQRVFVKVVSGWEFLRFGGIFYGNNILQIKEVGRHVFFKRIPDESYDTHQILWQVSDPVKALEEFRPNNYDNGFKSL